MSGLSTMQRQVLRLAMTINAATQNGMHGLKTGAALPGYHNARSQRPVPTIDYHGPVDLNASILLWALTDADLSGDVHNCHFTHTTDSLCAKAALIRSTTRLHQRGALVYTPNWPREHGDPREGYVLTAEGMRLAEPDPLIVPALSVAMELLGVTRLHHGGDEKDWRACDRREQELLPELKMARRNGYQLRAGGKLVTVEETTTNGYQRSDVGTLVTVEQNHGQRLSKSRRATSATADVIDV
jgi:hypothetical protein